MYFRYYTLTHFLYTHLASDIHSYALNLLPDYLIPVNRNKAERAYFRYNYVQ